MKLLILLNIIIVVAIIPNAHSQLSDDIGVQLSLSCIRMVQHGLDSNCPSYEEIMFLFPDSSDQRISGQFVFDDGYLHRENSKFANSEQYYRYDKEKRFWVDPPPRVADSIKLITIQPRIDEYIIGGQKITNSSVLVGYDSWVNEGCHNAIITAKNWQIQLGNMIQHLGSDCKLKNLDNIKKKSWERTVHDITTSYKYQLEKWIKESIERCGKRVCFYE